MVYKKNRIRRKTYIGKMQEILKIDPFITGNNPKIISDIIIAT